MTGPWEPRPCAECSAVAPPYMYVLGHPVCSYRCLIRFGATWLRERQSA
jgi:hypothetical protein